MGLKELINSSNQSNPIPELVKDLLEKIYPLTAPMLENSSSQGFMWEREWRYYPKEDETGLTFDYTSISVICCPAEEEPQIREILKPSAHTVAYVRSWQEYNEVTNFLQQREAQRIPSSSLTPTTDPMYKKSLEDEKLELEITRNSLLAYQEIIDSIKAKENSVHQSLHEIDTSIKSITAKLDKIPKQY